MRLFRVCLIIVFALSTLTVLADGTSKKRKVLEKPYTGEARLRPGEPSVDFCFSDINCSKNFESESSLFFFLGCFILYIRYS